MTSKLKEARLNAGYSIEEISEKLNIRKQYLIDLEEENFDAMPGKIYIDGYTRLYAKFLGLEDYNVTKNDEVKIVKTPKHKARVKNSNNLKYIVLLSLALLVVVFIIYSYLSDRLDSNSSILDKTNFISNQSDETTIIGHYNSNK